MKIVPIGLGQCGCRIADKFLELQKRTKRIKFITDVFAINTDEADLSGLRYIPKGTNHRISIGGLKTFGHGVGGVNQIAFEIIKEQAPSIVTTILESQRFYEADAVLLIASGAGGTGSGSIAQLTKELKKRMLEAKPIYAIVVLPFSDEEAGEASFAVTNTATCLAAVNQVTDALILVENERFLRKGQNLLDNIHEINTQIVENFVDLFCAGEEKDPRKIGAKTLDAGDIKESMREFTSVGRGVIPVSVWRSMGKTISGRSQFHEGLKEDATLSGALNKAINNLSVKCNLEDACRLCYLISAPKDVVSPTTKAEIRRHLSKLAPRAEIRGGDYPGGSGHNTTLTLIFSELMKVERVEKIYARAKDLLVKQKDLMEEKKKEFQRIKGLAEGLPSLLESEE